MYNNKRKILFWIFLFGIVAFCLFLFFPHFGEKEIERDKTLVGLWFEPHGADHNIVFDKDSTFTYHTFAFPTEETYQEVIIHGHYIEDDDVISLIGDNGWEFKMYRKHNGTNYYLTSSREDEGLYLVKGN